MGDSMEATQARVKRAVDAMLDDIDKNYLRDMQKSMFQCSAKCCDDKRGSRDNVERCIDNCNSSMKKAQNVLERELESLQGALSRCAMTCYDKLVMEYGPDQSKYSPDQMTSFQAKLDKCVSVCADDHVKLLPGIKSRFAKSL